MIWLEVSCCYKFSTDFLQWDKTLLFCFRRWHQVATEAGKGLRVVELHRRLSWWGRPANSSGKPSSPSHDHWNFDVRKIPAAVAAIAVSSRSGNLRRHHSSRWQYCSICEWVDINKLLKSSSTCSLYFLIFLTSATGELVFKIVSWSVLIVYLLLFQPVSLFKDVSWCYWIAMLLDIVISSRWGIGFLSSFEPSVMLYDWNSKIMLVYRAPTDQRKLEKVGEFVSSGKCRGKILFFESQGKWCWIMQTADNCDFLHLQILKSRHICTFNWTSKS